jgi:hypothetical protein
MEPKKPNKARFADPAAHIPYYMHRFAPSRVTASSSAVERQYMLNGVYVIASTDREVMLAGVHSNERDS